MRDSCVWVSSAFHFLIQKLLLYCGAFSFWWYLQTGGKKGAGIIVAVLYSSSCFNDLDISDGSIHSYSTWFVCENEGPVLWHTWWSCPPQHLHSVRVLVHVLDALLPIQPPDNGMGEQWKMAQVFSPLLPTWESQMKLLASAWAGLGSKPAKWKILFVSLK